MESFDPARVRDYMDGMISKVEMVASQTGRVTEMIFALSCPRDKNFRRKICPNYKAHRSAVTPPPGIPEAREMLKEWGRTWQGTVIEADDYVGIALTSPGGEDLVAVSIDKDFKQIPGKHIHLLNPVVIEEVSRTQADYWHMSQTLIGDSADGYPGCPGVGPVGARKALDGVDPKDWWSAVIKVFEEHGLTEQDALKQARLARILRRSEWNAKTMKPRLWKP